MGTSAARESAQLKMAANRLEAEAFHTAEATEELCSRSQELELIANRLQSEKDDAMAVARQRDAQQRALWGRLAGLASVHGNIPQADATVSDLVEAIGREWTDARRRNDWSQK